MPTALVTGCGSDGLGRALAFVLAARGWAVTATCRTDAQVRAARRDAGDAAVTWATLDLASDEDLVGLARSLPPGPLDLAVNCAAYARREPALDELRRAPLLEAMSVNVYGLFALARTLAPRLLAAAAPRFVAIGSSMGSFAEPAPHGRYGYRTSKAAAHMAVRILAAEPALAPVVVTAVHPGWFRTKLGGPDAPLAPGEAAADLADLLERLGPEQHDGLVDRFGKRLPW